MSRNMKLFITASVMLNLLLASMMLGHLFRPEDPRSQDLIVEAIDASSLPQERKAALKDKIAASENMEQIRAESQRLREAQYAVLTAQTFDRDAFVKLNAQIASLWSDRRGRMNDNVADIAAEMNQQDRTKLAESLKKMSARWKSRSEGKAK